MALFLHLSGNSAVAESIAQAKTLAKYPLLGLILRVLLQHSKENLWIIGEDFGPIFDFQRKAVFERLLRTF